jgi:hypothetical protein
MHWPAQALLAMLQAHHQELPASEKVEVGLHDLGCA